MKKTLYVLALLFAISVAAFGILASNPSNVMSKGDSDGIRAGL